MNDRTMRHRSRRVAGVAFALIATAACGTAPGPDTRLIHVAGSYPTAVALGTNGCGAVEVQPQTTVVQHAAGAATFSLTHGPVTYAGTLQATGDFTTAPSQVASGGSTFALTVAGRFRVSGFDATVTVVVTPPQGAAPCQYTVAWTGTKTGDPNVIP